jgi:hypothetical protein
MHLECTDQNPWMPCLQGHEKDCKDKTVDLEDLRILVRDALCPTCHKRFSSESARQWLVKTGESTVLSSRISDSFKPLIISAEALDEIEFDDLLTTYKIPPYLHNHKELQHFREIGFFSSKELLLLDEDEVILLAEDKELVFGSLQMLKAKKQEEFQRLQELPLNVKIILIKPFVYQLLETELISLDTLMEIAYDVVEIKDRVAAEHLLRDGFVTADQLLQGKWPNVTPLAMNEDTWSWFLSLRSQNPDGFALLSQCPPVELEHLTCSRVRDTLSAGSISFTDYVHASKSAKSCLNQEALYTSIDEGFIDLDTVLHQMEGSCLDKVIENKKVWGFLKSYAKQHGLKYSELYPKGHFPISESCLSCLLTGDVRQALSQGQLPFASIIEASPEAARVLEHPLIINAIKSKILNVQTLVESRSHLAWLSLEDPEPLKWVLQRIQKRPSEEELFFNTSPAYAVQSPQLRHAVDAENLSVEDFLHLEKDSGLFTLSQNEVAWAWVQSLAPEKKVFVSMTYASGKLLCSESFREQAIKEQIPLEILFRVRKSLAERVDLCDDITTVMLMAEGDLSLKELIEDEKTPAWETLLTVNNDHVYPLTKNSKTWDWVITEIHKTKKEERSAIKQALFSMSHAAATVLCMQFIRRDINLQKIPLQAALDVHEQTPALLDLEEIQDFILDDLFSFEDIIFLAPEAEHFIRFILDANDETWLWIRECCSNDAEIKENFFRMSEKAALHLCCEEKREQLEADGVDLKTFLEKQT